MKRIIISWLLAVSAWLTATATNTITLTSAQGHPGEEVEIAVTLTNSDEVTALEILVPLNDMLRYVDGSAVLNAERSNGHTLTASAKDGNLSICIYNFSLAPVKGTGGEICRFKVKLGKEPADYDLVPEVVLSDKSGTSLDCSVSKGVVTLLSPKIEITTPTLAYGRVPIRSSYTKTLTIRNTGNESLEISDIDFDADDLSASPATCSIAAGTAKEITVTYSPMQRGDVTKNVTITSNAINPKAGKAVVTAQPFSVNELHVQRAEGISDEEVTVVLKMNNMEFIAGAQCSFKMPKELVYVEGSASAGAMCANTGHVALGSLQGDVLTLMLYSATNNVIPEGDGELMTFRVRLNGKSGWYNIKPTDVVLGNITMENMVSATSGEYVVIKSPSYNGADKLDMGRVAVADKQTGAYTITNTGEVDLVINKVTFLAEGYAVEDSLPLAIAPWESKSLTVSYTPSEEGEHKTTMQIYTNDPTNRMFSVLISGQVYEPNTINVSGENTAEGYRFAFGLDNYTEIVAVQMNIKWLPGMKTSMEQFMPTDRLGNHSYLLTDLGNGLYQVLIYSMNNTPIVGTEGALFTLDYTALDGVEYKDTELKVTDIVLSDSKGNNYVSESDRSATASFTNFVFKYLVIFKIGDEVIASDSLAYGSVIVTPEAPAKEGHTFSGWSDIPETMPAEDVTVTGSFAVNKYKLTYVVDGNVFHTDSVAYGSRLSAIDEPVKDGCTFSGWVGLPEFMPAKDVTVTGSFVTNGYKLTYMVDGEIYKTIVVEYGTAITPEEAPVKEGHTFSGWSDIPETMPAEDVTVTGSFAVNKYKLTYIVDGSEYHTDSVAYGSKLTAIEVPAKVGHTFSGWDNVPETMPAKDVVVTGSYTVNKYLVTFKIGDEVIASDSLAYGSAIVAPEAPEREGHTFIGWGEVLQYVPAHDVTFVGCYTVNIYKVYYYVGEELVHTKEVAYGAAMPSYEYEPSNGDVFNGWDGEHYDTMPAHDVTYIANITSSISMLQVSGRNMVVYDLNGRRIYDLGALKSGLYIVNGKRVLVK